MKRRDPVLVAALVVAAFLALLAVWGRERESRPTTTASGRFSTVIFNPVPGRSRTLDVTVSCSAEKYVTIHVLPPSGPAQRLFPPLGRPEGIPWPLPAGKDVKLRGDAGLVVPENATGFLVLRFVDDPAADLVVPDGIPREMRALEAEYGAGVYDLRRLR